MAVLPDRANRHKFLFWWTSLQLAGLLLSTYVQGFSDVQCTRFLSSFLKRYYNLHWDLSKTALGLLVRSCMWICQKLHENLLEAVRWFVRSGMWFFSKAACACGFLLNLPSGPIQSIRCNVHEEEVCPFLKFFFKHLITPIYKVSR